MTTEVKEPAPLTRVHRARAGAKFFGDVATMLQKGALAPARDDLRQVPRRLASRFRLPLAKTARFPPLLWTLIAGVGLPTLAAVIYLFFIAANQYVSEVRFSIRGVEQKSNSDMIGALVGMPSIGNNLSDSYLVVNYVSSREIVEDLLKIVDIRQMYSSHKADYFSRLAEDAPIDELVKYWKRMVGAGVDTLASVVMVEVRAFTPEDAKAIADAVVVLSERLVNEISERARRDMVRFAAEEVKRTEERLHAARSAVRAFRDQEGAIDPARMAEATLTTIGKLTEERLALEQEMATRRQTLGPTSPVVRTLLTKVQAIDEQIKALRAQVTQTDEATRAISGQISRYEDLQLEQQFAEKAHAAALASLEKARAEADRQHLFIVPFVRPGLAEDWKYPRRGLGVLVTAMAAFAAWAIGTLLFYGIRDHVV